MQPAILRITLKRWANTQIRGSLIFLAKIEKGKGIRMFRQTFKFRLSILTIASVLVLTAGRAISVQATEQKESKQRVELKEVQGRISWLRKDMIAIVYAATETSEEEILLPLSKDTRLLHLKSLEQLRVGDVVSIQYEEITEETPEGPRVNLVAKTVIFVRPARPKALGVEGREE